MGRAARASERATRGITTSVSRTERSERDRRPSIVNLPSGCRVRDTPVQLRLGSSGAVWFPSSYRGDDNLTLSLVPRAGQGRCVPIASGPVRCPHVSERTRSDHLRYHEGLSPACCPRIFGTSQRDHASHESRDRPTNAERGG